MVLIIKMLIINMGIMALNMVISINIHLLELLELEVQVRRAPGQQLLKFSISINIQSRVLTLNSIFTSLAKQNNE